jgi:hypothetical protein
MSKRAGQPIENPEKKKARTDTPSHEQKRSDDELFIDVTTNGRKIMPSNVKKYTGSITQTKRNLKKKWKTQISNEGYKESKHHATKEDAEAHIKEVNIRENLPIKNIIYEYKSKYYCTLTHEKLMLFSYEEDITLVDSNIWHSHTCTNKYYSVTNVKNDNSKRSQQFLFHRLVLNTEVETVDHKNRNSLDNRRKNLRPATPQIQALNRGTMSNNTSGRKGVSLDKNRWCATWSDEKGHHLKSFSFKKHGGYDAAKEKAIAFRENIERTNPQYMEALYPLIGEL